MDKANFIGRLITVDNFDVYADDGTKVYDGQHILGFIGDKAWFKIKQQDMALDMWFNPNNRSWQYYLNEVRMYNYSLFANGVILANDDPVVDATAVAVDKATVSVAEGATATVNVTTTPFSSNATLSVASSAEGKATATISGKTVTISGVDAGSATVTVTATNSDTTTVTATIAVTVTE
jgi:hypothetical protein